jgi:hypothetical protein
VRRSYFPEIVRQRMMLGMVVVEDLSNAEQQVWDAFPTGRLATCGTGNAEDDDPAGGEGWGPERQVRAEVLAALLCGAVEVPPGQVGKVWLQHARVTGKIDLSGIELKHTLLLVGCYIAEGINLSEATTRSLGLKKCHVGPSCLSNAKVNGVVNFRGTHLGTRYVLPVGTFVLGWVKPALEADGLTVTASMVCDEGFRADGEIDLLGANIGGSLSFEGAHLDGSGGFALNGQGLTVTHQMFCNKDFHADGEVSLLGANIGRQLSLDGAHLDGRTGFALNAQGLTVTQQMFCREDFVVLGRISLAGANIGWLLDAKQCWPEHLLLDGLTYGDITYMPAKERLDWLNLSRSYGYRAQPYEQLAAYYRRLGHDDQAWLVLLAKQRQRRRQRPWWARWWGWLQDGLVGYGYAPGRALLLLAAAFAVGCLVFSIHHPVFVGRGLHPAFNAALYTLDVLIPALAFGQASSWNPQGVGLAVATGLHILGWLLAVAVIAAITRSFTRT